MRRGALIILAALLLPACGQAEPEPAVRPAPTAEQALLLKPSDTRLAQLYETSCKTCHAVPGSGAPLVHDTAEWNRRWKRGGVDELIDNTLIGYNGMPAGGQCVGCEIDDYGALIRFMAGREDPAK